MGKALPFPAHIHPPSTRGFKPMLRIGALTNDQGVEGEAPENDTNDPNQASDEGDATPARRPRKD